MKTIIYKTIIGFLSIFFIAQLANITPSLAAKDTTPIAPSTKATLTIEDVSDNPDPFSPNGDGFEDTTTIQATIKAYGFRKSRLSLIYKITIMDNLQKIVAQFTHKRVVSNNSETVISDIWNGRNKKNKPLPDGEYTYRVDARIEKPKKQAEPVSGRATIKTTPLLSVSLRPDTWDVGPVDVNGVITTGEEDKIVVTNDGVGFATYSLSLVNPSGWTASQTKIGLNTYILNAAFSERIEDINWNEGDHALSIVPVRSTNTKFAGSQTGVNVTPRQTRTLWFQFKAPEATPITTEQEIEVIVNAELP